MEFSVRDLYIIYCCVVQHPTKYSIISSCLCSWHLDPRRPLKPVSRLHSCLLYVIHTASGSVHQHQSVLSDHLLGGLPRDQFSIFHQLLLWVNSHSWLTEEAQLWQENTKWSTCWVVPVAVSFLKLYKSFWCLSTHRPRQVTECWCTVQVQLLCANTHTHDSMHHTHRRMETARHRHICTHTHTTQREKQTRT